MANKGKSVFDGIKIKEVGFDETFNKDFPPEPPLMEVVGACNKCGNPIYGHHKVLEKNVVVKRTCECCPTPLGIGGTMRTT